MEKPKIKVLTIDLGIDTTTEIKKSAQEVSKDVKDRITKMVEEKKTEEANNPKNKEKAIAILELAQMKVCVQKLFTGEEFDGKQIAEAYGIKISLSPLILKLRNYLKKNHPEFELIKVGKKYRAVKKTEAPSSSS